MAAQILMLTGPRLAAPASGPGPRTAPRERPLSGARAAWALASGAMRRELGPGASNALAEPGEG
ncbi:MAG: hypothetical protein LBQ12_02435, partial [Deltaproteobacteria bacterium]|nr:hypothetical protein [Deltaproteobacteria bacterium]